MKFKIQVYTIMEFGERKDAAGNPHQEDSIFPDIKHVGEDDRLFILCDGMGGHDAGEVASATVCEAMGRYILTAEPDPEGAFKKEDIENAVSAAYDALDQKDTGSAKKMGTTMTLLKLYEGGAYVAHMGDSRVYHIRPGENDEEARVMWRTEDHSLVNDLVRIGEMTEEEARTSRQKNIITRAMQPNQERRSRADIHRITDIRPGDYFYMCSDGMLEQMNDTQLCYHFSKAGGEDPQKVESLVNATLLNHDNHTAFIIHILDVIGEPVPEPMPESDPKSKLTVKAEDEVTSPSVPPVNTRSANDNVVYESIPSQKPLSPHAPLRKKASPLKKMGMMLSILSAVAVIAIVVLVFLPSKNDIEEPTSFDTVGPVKQDFNQNSDSPTKLTTDESTSDENQSEESDANADGDVQEDSESTASQVGEEIKNVINAAEEAINKVKSDGAETDNPSEPKKDPKESPTETNQPTNPNAQAGQGTNNTSAAESGKGTNNTSAAESGKGTNNTSAAESGKGTNNTSTAESGKGSKPDKSAKSAKPANKKDSKTPNNQ